MGLGLSVLLTGKGYRVGVEWGKVRNSCRGVLERWFGAENREGGEGKRVIGTKWVFRNKRDERGTIIKNKARLVAQGYRQEEGVDLYEVLHQFARIESNQTLLAIASFLASLSLSDDCQECILIWQHQRRYRDVGLWESDSKLRKNGFYKKLFKTCCMSWGEVNPTHAYYNGSCTSKDIEDPSWSTSFKTRRTQKTSSALEALWKTLFGLYLYLIGTL
ncbi:putative ribonuclease H-like domain-containing protein [Tanacetum coccineum]